mmetsp:Transcript_133692/g.260339  ORF Transcript_133692/g.260339 Transcript_133692/m.260339 type:complete len:188 (+) Transcript_133692:90-653(+)
MVQSGAHPSEHTMPPPVAQPAGGKPVHKHVVSFQEIEGHFPICFTESSNTCAICLFEIGASDPCRRTTCKHEFHADCIMTWWTKERGKVLNCPTCREAQKFSVKKVRQVSIDVQQKENFRQPVAWRRSQSQPPRQQREESYGTLSRWFESVRLGPRRPLGTMSGEGRATETPSEEALQMPNAGAVQH